MHCSVASGILDRPALPVGLSVIIGRVLRGGSWDNDQDNARAAYRNDNHPHNRNDNNGFRVVRCSHIFCVLRTSWVR